MTDASLVDRLCKYSSDISESETEQMKSSPVLRERMRSLTSAGLAKKDFLAILQCLKDKYYIYRTGFEILKGQVEPGDFILLRLFKKPEEISDEETKAAVWISLHSDMTMECLASCEQTAVSEIQRIVGELETALDTKIYTVRMGKENELSLLRSKVRRNNLRLAIPLISLVIASSSVTLAFSRSMEYALLLLGVGSLIASLVFWSMRESVDKLENII